MLTFLLAIFFLHAQANAQPKAAPSRVLTLEEVLGWRSMYADMIGKSKDALIERYGPPLRLRRTKDFAGMRTGKRSLDK